MLAINPEPLRSATLIIIPESKLLKPEPVTAKTIDTLVPNISTKNPFMKTEIP